MPGIPLRPLGATGVMVSALGLGGHAIGRIPNRRDAIRVVHAAVDAGVTFMDNAWEYHQGRSEEVMGAALAGRRDATFLMTKVCTHGRGRREALRQLEQSLRRLKTDYLDLWQVHECVYDNDPERHAAPGGVLEALARAKEDGTVRFVGFTGHKRPEIHLEMLATNFPFDTCLHRDQRDRLAGGAAQERHDRRRIPPDVAPADGSPAPPGRWPGGRRPL